MSNDKYTDGVVNVYTVFISGGVGGSLRLKSGFSRGHQSGDIDILSARAGKEGQSGLVTIATGKAFFYHIFHFNATINNVDRSYVFPLLVVRLLNKRRQRFYPSSIWKCNRRSNWICRSNEGSCQR